YGTRGKSKWIREAFLLMLKYDPKMMLVGQGDSLDGINKVRDLITLPLEIKDLLDSKVLLLKTTAVFPEAGISLILRSAIRFRLDNPMRILGKPSSVGRD